MNIANQIKDTVAPHPPGAGAGQDAQDGATTQPPTLAELRSMRILIVDDIPTNLVLLRGMLQHGGFANILTAASGYKALEMLERHSNGSGCGIDVMLLDIIMPNMDGYAVCRALRERAAWSDIPVIMITSEDKWREETAQASFDAGAADIMFKPIRSLELLPRVISALSLKRERDLRKQREQSLQRELAERKAMEARLQYLVMHDELTGLYNRHGLEPSLVSAAINAHSYNEVSALLYIDLDQFKIINDTEGHSAGDELIVEVAQRLRSRIADADVIARIGSDEFAILRTGTTREGALEFANAIRSDMQSFRFQGRLRAHQVSVSIGVAMVTSREIQTANDILAHGDQACFVAKNHGRNVVHLFSSEDQEVVTMQRDVHWVPLIKDALENDGFRLALQPVLQISDARITHYEVLIRMIGDNGEVLTPGEFIPVAERMGLIHDVDRWVVRHAITMLATLYGDDDVCLNINLSGHAFQDATLLTLIRDQLAGTGVAAQRIIFEITETAAIANFNQTRNMVRQLRELGCRFALDDFGSGFNSYSYLKQFPVDYLKIDGTFVRNLLNDPTDQALVRSMAEIARTLNKQTVAEFVENAEVLTLLAEYGVDFAQGYYIGRPELRD